MLEVMVDLETLGKRAGCKILSIGAVVFGPAGLGAEFYVEVRRDHQPGLHEDESTVKWWDAQTPEARERLFHNQPGKTDLRKALESFNDWLIKLAPVDDKNNLQAAVWGNGADFDNAILHAAYAEVACEPPVWPYWGNRCYRTLKSLRPDVKLVRSGVHHNALDDAKSQALHAVRLLAEMGYWKPPA